MKSVNPVADGACACVQLDLGWKGGVRENTVDPTIGDFSSAPMMSANTNNFVIDRYYTYLPGSGNKSEAVCQASADSYHSYCMTTEECMAGNYTLTDTSDYLRCDQFKGGHLNPYGLRIIDYQSSEQLIRPTIKVIPQAFEYDILSNTILAIVTYFPLEDPYMTQDGTNAPILSLVAINETTGMLHDCPSDIAVCSEDAAYGQQSMTFCMDCARAPKFLAADWIVGGKIANVKALDMDYDYTQVAAGSTAFDSLNQRFYCILSNTNVERSATLFSIKRLSILAGDEDPDSPYYYYGPSRSTGPPRASRPKDGIWIVEIQWDTFKHWQWPPHLVLASTLEFGPKQVTRVFTATGAATNAYEPVSDDEHTLFASCGIKERGACLYYRCGIELTQDMIDTCVRATPLRLPSLN